jgi:hypothetical protein
MSRSRASARQAGSKFERDIADYFRSAWCKFIDRMPKHGSRDQGDIQNFYVGDTQVAVECKVVAKIDLAGWYKEAQTEAMNLGAPVGIVVAKRRGLAAPANQWCIMTVGDFVYLLTLALRASNASAKQDRSGQEGEDA